MINDETVTFVHKTRPGIHRVLFMNASLQASTGPVHEGERMLVYSSEDGEIWVRSMGESMDGRFIPLETIPVVDAHPRTIDKLVENDAIHWAEVVVSFWAGFSLGVIGIGGLGIAAWWFW